MFSHPNRPIIEQALLENADLIPILAISELFGLGHPGENGCNSLSISRRWRRALIPPRLPDDSMSPLIGIILS